ncbi:hypothetical protein NP233_g6583 [Leucocoprinus birnbaumii]|uniref:Polysaccharide lyase 14 domain-containing protein n=1 Tax=Leucocoprinus birnbaumii TaxID=56174 RepID=A0AAD5VQR4_9AGAR|nr:hypothetical protein NP233_g6583 [Leucocoprinus birnbaumii]
MDLFLVVPILLTLLGWSLAIPFSSGSGLGSCLLQDMLVAIPPTHDQNISSTTSVSDEPLFYPAVHQTTASSSPMVSSLAASPGNAPMTVTITVVLQASSITEYVTLPPMTTTKTIEITPTHSSSVESRPRPTEAPGSGSSLTSWSAPSRMADLSSFGITYFPSGQHNVQVVSSLSLDIFRNIAGEEDSLIQILYPAHSVNPAQEPVGGASFYASPIDLSSATNVSLQYSVFFPLGFDWVKGGKLPGLYGGRTGCSGGTDAEDCFSTRLMWRAQGVGELYLYAPKSRQPKSLCSAPGSACNTDYGFSIGRGSFKWPSGKWTSVTQTVALNTEGKANGGFALSVNAQPVIERRDIFYRDGDLVSPAKPTKTDSGPPSTRSHTLASATKTSSSGGLLGDLLNPLMNHGTSSHRLSDDDDRHQEAPHWVDRIQRLFSVNVVARKNIQQYSANPANIDVQIPLLSASLDIGGDMSVHVGFGDDRDGSDGTKEQHSDQVGLLGIFFSTFFGGHEDKYATPKDQYIWFKDFSLTING